MRLYPNPTMANARTNGCGNARSAPAHGSLNILTRLLELRPLCFELTPAGDRREAWELRDELDLGMQRWTSVLSRSSTRALTPRPRADDVLPRLEAALSLLLPKLCNPGIDRQARMIALYELVLGLTEPGSGERFAEKVEVIGNSLIVPSLPPPANAEPAPGRSGRGDRWVWPWAKVRLRTSHLKPGQEA